MIIIANLPDSVFAQALHDDYGIDWRFDPERPDWTAQRLYEATWDSKHWTAGALERAAAEYILAHEDDFIFCVGDIGPMQYQGDIGIWGWPPELPHRASVVVDLLLRKGRFANGGDLEEFAEGGVSLRGTIA